MKGQSLPAANNRKEGNWVEKRYTIMEPYGVLAWRGRG